MTEAPARRPVDRSPEAADWLACRGCGTLLYRKRHRRELGVCTECGHHGALSTDERVRQLLDRPSDPTAVVEIAAPECPDDPLSFVDTKPYEQRLADARAGTELDEAVRCVRGCIEERPVVLAVMDFGFLGGSLGVTVGERITCAAEEALRRRTPLVLVTASGGARMQEGTLSLMQMVKTSQAMAQLDEAGVLTVGVVTDPTYGGVAASFGSLADVIVAETGARLGFAGRRVIEQTIGGSLPADFQTAEFLLEHGLVDAVVPRNQLKVTLIRLLDAAGGSEGPCSTWPPDGERAVIDDPRQLPAPSPWEVVGRARDTDRPTASDYIAALVDGFVELHGDRAGEDCPAIVGGVGRLGHLPVVALGHQKGHTTTERLERNFGMPSPAGFRKAARFMRLAAKLRLPVITFIDTPGAYPGQAAEERGQAAAIAENLRLMARLPVPIVAVVTGEGGSGGALALGVADRVLMFENAVYSVISPEGCAAILWQTPKAAPDAAAALRLTARELLELGVADGVVPEPVGGAHTDQAQAANRLRRALGEALDTVRSLSERQLRQRRWNRFRRFGAGGPISGGTGG